MDISADKLKTAEMMLK